MRVGFAAVTALLLVLLGGWFGVELVVGRWWLWPLWAVAWLTAIVAPRIAILAILRRQEYAADRAAATLLGSPDSVVAFLDWVSARGGELPAAPLPVRLWTATHPSNAARRRALLNGARGSAVSQSSQGR